MDSYHTANGLVKTNTPSGDDSDLFGHKPNTIEARYPESPGAKASGTALEAAVKITGHSARLRKTVLQEFMAAGQGGLTADQCARRVEENILSVRPRCSELKRLGYLSYTGARAENESGMTANILRATPKAFEAFR
jgi:hypothetical protein